MRPEGPAARDAAGADHRGGARDAAGGGRGDGGQGPDEDGRDGEVYDEDGIPHIQMIKNG